MDVEDVRFDWVRVIDSATGTLSREDVNSNASVGAHTRIYNVYVHADVETGSAFSYVYNVRNDGGDWQSVQNKSTHYFTTIGSNLDVRVTLNNSEVAYETPVLYALSLSYNLLEVETHALRSEYESTSNVVIDYRVLGTLDEAQSASVFLRQENGTMIDVSTFATLTNLATNTFRVTFDFKGFRESAGDTIPFGAYGIAVSNVTAQEGAIAVDVPYVVANAVHYGVISKDASDVTIRMYPPALRQGLGEEMSFYINTGGAESLTVIVYAEDGRVVRTLCDGITPLATYSAVWNARDDNGQEVRPGRYFIMVRTPSMTKTHPVYIFE